MNRILPTDLQLLNEQTYCRKHIDVRIRNEIETNVDLIPKILGGVALLETWLEGDYYDSKNLRIAPLKDMDLTNLVLDVFVGVTYCEEPELFTSVTAQLASRLKFSEKADGIRTIAEILAVLCETDVFDIIKPSRTESLYVKSHIPISDELRHFIHESRYLPPMVCIPRELKTNYQSAYMTFNDSLILGSGKHHNGDLCLDVINSKNRVPLKLDTDFISTVEEEPTNELDTLDKRRDWIKFKQDSYKFYTLIVNQGNEFYLTHKVCNRGRLYAQGYHISTQGSPFKKAMIELAEEEYVDGVPS